MLFLVRMEVDMDVYKKNKKTHQQLKCSYILHQQRKFVYFFSCWGNMWLWQTGTLQQECVWNSETQTHTEQQMHLMSPLALNLNYLSPQGKVLSGTLFFFSPNYPPVWMNALAPRCGRILSDSSVSSYTTNLCLFPEHKECHLHNNTRLGFLSLTSPDWKRWEEGRRQTAKCWLREKYI